MVPAIVSPSMDPSIEGLEPVRAMRGQMRSLVLGWLEIPLTRSKRPESG